MRFCTAAPTRACFYSGVFRRDYAPCHISMLRLFATPEFNCVRGCALFAQAAMTRQVRVVTARQLPSPASTAAGGQHHPAPLLLLAMEPIKMLW